MWGVANSIQVNGQVRNVLKESQIRILHNGGPVLLQLTKTVQKIQLYKKMLLEIKWQLLFYFKLTSF